VESQPSREFSAGTTVNLRLRYTIMTSTLRLSDGPTRPFAGPRRFFETKF